MTAETGFAKNAHNAARRSLLRRSPETSAVVMLVILLLAALLSTGAAEAQKTINVPKDQPTIQAGINAASNGDTVLVAPGTYNESIDFKGKAITVISSGGPAKTIIDGGARTYTVLFKTKELRESTLSGFTIQNGGKVPNYFSSYGGIGISSAAPTIVGNVITNNFCYNINAYISSPLILNNEISSALDSGDVCSFAGGAGILIQGNYQDSGLPGTPGPPAIMGNTIESNVDSGTEDAGGNGGAGIAVWGGDPVIENNIIRNNKTYGQGGGINIVSGGAIVAQNLIYGNMAGTGGGGLAFDFGSAQGPGAVTGFVINNVIADNTYFHEVDRDDGFGGSQVYIWAESSQTEFANNIIVGASSDQAVLCDPTWDGGAAPLNIFDHNDVFNPGGAAFGGTCPDQTGTYGNISADPLFVDAAHNDYHLRAGSPAIDSGNDSALQQLDNNGAGLGYDFQSVSNERVQDATAKGYPIVDMGAYEFSGAQDASPTTILLTPSAYVVNGGSLTLTAHLVSVLGSPVGTVTFYQDQKQIGSASLDAGGDASGSVTIAAPSLTPGVYAFVATYPGSVVFAPGISVEVIVLVQATTQSGNPTATSLTSSLNPANVGQSVTLTATVASHEGTPPGNVAFTDGSATLCNQPLSGGIATCAASLAAGSHTITATYQPGASGFASSSASLVQVVNGLPSATTLTIKPTSPYALAPTQLTAVVKGQAATPTGKVTFSDATGVLTTAKLDATGTAVALYQFPSAGSDTVTAAYSGDATYSTSSSSPVALTVVLNDSAASVTASPNPANALRPVTLNATVGSDTAFFFSVSAFGAVTFYDGATSLGTANLASGYATLATSALAAGPHSITVAYPGNSAFKPSKSAPYTLTVNPNPTSIALTASPNPAVIGSSVTFTAAVSSAAAPTGTVTFEAGDTALGTVVVDAKGNAIFSTTTLAVGTHSITAHYAGTQNFLASSSAAVSERIFPYAGDFAVALTPAERSPYTGEAAQFTVALTPSGGWNQDVTLACGPLPANTTCSFNPAVVPGGNGGSNLVIQTSAPHHVANTQPRNRFPWQGGAAALASLGLLILPRRSRRRAALLGVLAFAMIGAMNGCGAGPVAGGTPPGSYTIAVTASFSKAGQTVIHSSTVRMIVKSLF